MIEALDLAVESPNESDRETVDLTGFTMYRLTRESDGHVVMIAAESMEAMLSKLHENYPPNQDRWTIAKFIHKGNLKATPIEWPKGIECPS